MEKKTDKPILELALPFVQLDNDRVCDTNNYDESGIFFVKDLSGMYHIVEVRLEEKVVFGTCINADVCNMLTEQLVAGRMGSVLNPVCYRLEELNSAICNTMDDVVRKLDELTGSHCDYVEGLSSLDSKVEHLGSVLVGLESAVCCAVEKKSSDVESVKGYVSEESLVEIIKNVRK